MKIYSWNILYRNEELDRAFDFIAESDFDIFCLQEVPDDFLRRLQMLPFYIASRTDVERLLPHETSHNSLVVLSRHPIISHGEIPFPDYWNRLPVRTRFFVWAMPSSYFSRIQNRGGMFVDVDIDGKPFRFFNLHLVLAYPQLRREEFISAMVHQTNGRETIVCGDFNILQSCRIAPLNWMLGGTLGDTLLYQRERREVEVLFARYGLRNPLVGKMTHPFSHSQLDHILIPQTLVIENVIVFSDSIGSDHFPVQAVITSK